MRNRHFLMLAAWLACVALLGSAVTQPISAQADTITLKDAQIRPESIAWNAASSTWLVSSTAKGTIYEVAADGTAKPFIEDKDLKATAGLYIDAKTGKLYVVNSNFLSILSSGGFPGGAGQPQLPPGVTPPANGQIPPNFTPDAQMQQMIQQMMQNMDSTITLNVYDLKTKQRLQRVDLTTVAAAQGVRFANDVTTDPDGNAYVTDSFAGALYRVDAKGSPAYLSDPLLGGGGPAFGAAGGLGINGIAYHLDGVLLINKTSDGTLLKIALSDPSKVIAVKLSEPITGADGMRVRADGKIIVVSGQKSTLYVLGSSDKWTTATVEQKIAIPAGSTAVTFSDTEMFVLSGGAAGFGGGVPGQPPATRPANATIEAATIKRLPLK